MKLAILGATGSSGQQAVTQALEAGHEVVAIVRNPDKLQTKHDKLTVTIGDIFSVESLSKAFQGCDAVLSALGASATFFSRITFYLDSIKPITAAMRKENISRLILITSGCTKAGPNNPYIMEWFLKPVILGRVLRSMGEMEDYLESECKDLKYTVVKPPGLQNAPLNTDKELIAVEDQWHPDAGQQIPRANVAKFMLSCLDTEEYHNKMIFIALKR